MKTNFFKKGTRNAAHFNNRDDLVILSFILKDTVFSEVCLEPSRTSMMKHFAKIAESRLLFLQKKFGHRCSTEF